MNKGDNIKLECNKCSRIHYRPTEELALVKIKDKDYLLCQWHSRKYQSKEVYKQCWRTKKQA